MDTDGEKYSIFHSGLCITRWYFRGRHWPKLLNRSAPVEIDVVTEPPVRKVAASQIGCDDIT